jgi:hypothetical protein
LYVPVRFFLKEIEAFFVGSRSDSISSGPRRLHFIATPDLSLVVTVGLLNASLQISLHIPTSLLLKLRVRNMTDLQAINEQQMFQKNRDGEIMTGTTILALPFEGGVVVCADSRTSTGTYVANRVSDKLVQLSEYIYCCRSGSAADTQALTDYVHYYLSQWR